MRRLHALLASLVALAVLAAACGGGGGATSTPNASLTPIAGNSELVLGPNRFALALIDETNHPVLETPGAQVRLVFTAPDGTQWEIDARFVWAIPDANGFWAADVEFDQAGQWSAEAFLRRDGEELASVPLPFAVREDGIAPAIGDAAPPTENLTLAAEPNALRVTTDENPDPALYQLTVTEALGAGKPLLVIFATPAYCQTRFCGPVLDNVKVVREEFADAVNFIHIEPFELDDEGQLVTSETGVPVAAQPTLDWRLQTEPWVFIIDAQGRIAARFEGAASVEELRAALQAVAG